MTSEQYNLGRSLNSDWIRGKIKHRHQPTCDKNKVVRAKSACSDRSRVFGERSLFLAESDGDEDISETAKDFKLTLQLFKRLSQQVHEVNQHMNKNKTYSYKHHLNNEGISSPALRRSQLAVALSKREIPATEAPNDPITDIGAPVPTLRPPSQQKTERVVSKEAQSQAAVSRSSSPVVSFVRSPSHFNMKNSSESTTQKCQVKSQMEKELNDADATAKAEWIADCSDYEELFVAESNQTEGTKYGYHDPFPDNWVDETVEEAIFRGSKKKDLFMQRLFELGKVEGETILYERKKDKEYTSNHTLLKQKSNGKNQRQVAVQTGLPTSRTISSAKLPINMRLKSQVKVSRSFSAGKIATCVNSADERLEYIQTLRSSGYRLGQSFLPRSLFPRTREVATQFDDQTTQRQGLLKSQSSLQVTQKGTGNRLSKSQFCQSCKMQTSSSQNNNCTKNNPTLQSLRAQYQLKATECYDIIELAKTLEPPCKDQLKKAGLKSSTEKPSPKGTIPGKSCFSQRRISLTSDNMLVKGVNPSNHCHPRRSTGWCKSGKKTSKKR